MAVSADSGMAQSGLALVGAGSLEGGGTAAAAGGKTGPGLRRPFQRSPGTTKAFSAIASPLVAGAIAAFARPATAGSTQRQASMVTRRIIVPPATT